METKYTIYKLIDPITNEVRYIGLTINTLKQRLKSHMSEKGKSHKIMWVQKLKKDNLRPIIEMVEDNIYSYEEACLKEIYYIDMYNKTCNLTNLESGGSKNKKMSDITREKMRQSQLKRYETYKLVLSDETRKELSKIAKKRMKSKKVRENLRIKNKEYEDSKTPEQKLEDILKQANKWIVQYTKDMKFLSEYPSLRDAERKTKISRSNITKCCKGKVKSAGGFIWKYK